MKNINISLTLAILLVTQLPDALAGNSFDEILERLEYLENKVEDLDRVNADLRETNEALRVALQLQTKEHPFVLSVETGKKSSTHRMEKTHTEPIRSKRFVLNSGDQVAFTAAISPVTVENMKSMDIIKFETIITDIGGGYNNQSGVFVAPVSGIYMFSCSLLDDATHTTVHAELVHNQRILARIFAHAEANLYRDQGSNTVFAQVMQGDQVWVRIIENGHLTLGGELYSTFSGYLMSEM